METITKVDAQQLALIFQKNQNAIGPIVPMELTQNNCYVFDFTSQNQELQTIDSHNTQVFTQYLFGLIEQNQCVAGIGGYAEDRVIYHKSELFFDNREFRTIHLGLDLFVQPGTPILAPLDGKFHSVKNNEAFGDYGPTMVLEHEVDGCVFYTLYGHLSLESIKNVIIGRKCEQGQEIGQVGEPPINGDWPPHVHFQIITDMQGQQGDFPGVASCSQAKELLRICPDPNLMLQIPGV